MELAYERAIWRHAEVIDNFEPSLPSLPAIQSNDYRNILTLPVIRERLNLKLIGSAEQQPAHEPAKGGR